MIYIHSLGYSADLPSWSGDIICHSTYRSAINLQIGERCAALLPIGKGLSPMAIYLAHQDFEYIQSNLQPRGRLQVGAETRSLFNNEFSIQLSGPVFRLKALHSDWNIQQGIAALTQLSLSKVTGLSCSVEELLTSDHYSTMRDLLQSIATGQNVDSEILKRFIGQGIGSTPAFDDMLIGALAYGYSFCDLSKSKLRTLEVLLEQGNELTTFISAEYLRLGYKGKFCSYLLSLIKELKAPTLDTERLQYRTSNLSRSGQTSGVDSLAGFIVATGCS